MKKQQHKYYFGKQCQLIIDAYNKELKQKLIPSKNEPIYGNTFGTNNTENEDFNLPISQLKQKR